MKATGRITAKRGAVAAYTAIPAASGGGVGSAPSFETVILDLTQTGLTTLVPQVAGKSWRTDNFRMAVATNAGLSTAAQLNAGVVAAAYSDMFNAFAVGGAFTALNSYLFAAVTTFPTVSVSAGPLVLNRAVAATGGVLTASFQIWGEYF